MRRYMQDASLLMQTHVYWTNQIKLFCRLLDYF